MKWRILKLNKNNEMAVCCKNELMVVNKIGRTAMEKRPRNCVASFPFGCHSSIDIAPSERLQCGYYGRVTSLAPAALCVMSALLLR